LICKNEAKKYFPQPNDDASVIRQKQHARDTAIKALEVQAGPGANIIRQTPNPKLDIVAPETIKYERIFVVPLTSKMYEEFGVKSPIPKPLPVNKNGTLSVLI
jgi:hypothetical protein